MSNPGSSVTVRRKRRKSSFAFYIYAILKNNIQGDQGISKKAMQTVDSFVGDMLMQLAAEAGRLAKYSGRRTIQERDVRAACMLIVQDREIALAADQAMNRYRATCK